MFVAKGVVEGVNGVDEFKDDGLSESSCVSFCLESKNGKSTTIFHSSISTPFRDACATFASSALSK